MNELNEHGADLVKVSAASATSLIASVAVQEVSAWISLAVLTTGLIYNLAKLYQLWRDRKKD